MVKNAFLRLIFIILLNAYVYTLSYARAESNNLNTSLSILSEPTFSSPSIQQHELFSNAVKDKFLLCNGDINLYDQRRLFDFSHQYKVHTNLKFFITPKVKLSFEHSKINSSLVDVYAVAYSHQKFSHNVNIKQVPSKSSLTILISSSKREPEQPITANVTFVIITTIIIIVLICSIIFVIYQKRQRDAKYRNFPKINANGNGHQHDTTLTSLGGQFLDGNQINEQTTFLPPDAINVDVIANNVENIALNNSDLVRRGSWPNGSFQKFSLASVTICSILCCSTAVSLVSLCMDPIYEAEIRVQLPPSDVIRSIEFYMENAASQIDISRWSNPGRQPNLKLFDIDTIQEPVGDFECEERTECHLAKQQGRLGCHPSSGACLCTRGFRFLSEKGACIDIDECSLSSNACSPNAKCINLVGSYFCKCKSGFYGNGKICKTCSAQCPPGQYVTSPCNGESDVQCHVCDECERGYYEAEQCLPRINRRCLHAARPLLANDAPLSDEDFHPVETSGTSRFTVQYSENVFPERRLDPSKRELQIGIVSNGNSKTLLWPGSNPSIRVNISLSKINLIPRYKDVYRTVPGPSGEPRDASDNAFTETYFQKVEKQSPIEGRQHLHLFKTIQTDYCRQPVPDFYMIQLVKHENVVSKVMRIPCAKKDRMSPTSYRCPPEYGSDEYYYMRLITTPCAEQISLYMKYNYLGENNPWKNAENQIGYSMEHLTNVFFCGQTTDLLKKVFNMTSFEELTLPTFTQKGTEACQSNAAKCLACQQEKQKLACKQDNAQKKQRTQGCCVLDCYLESSCINYYKKECVTATPTCGKGDVNRFSLTPVFQGISSTRKTFQCHLEYQKPDVLYALTYFLEVVKDGKKIWQGSAKSIEVPTSNASFHKSGSIEFGPLQVSHSSGIDLPQDYILVGDLSQGSGARLKVHRLASEVSPSNKSIDVSSAIAGLSTYFATVQVKRPFAVSSSTWINHHCFLNTTMLMANRTIYDDKKGIPIDMKVSQKLNDNPKSDIVYDLQNEPLAINLALPKGKSLLKDYFCLNHTLKQHRLLESPRGKLVQLQRNIWSISLTGFVADLPAYLTVKVKDIGTRSLLFSDELLIIGQKRFEANFTFPLSGASQDADLEVDVDDCIARSRVYLAQIWRETTAAGSPTVNRELPNQLASAGSSAAQAVMVPLVLCLIIGFVYLLLLVIFTLVRACRKPKRPQAAVGITLRGMQIPFQRKMVIVTYICFRVFYNFLFTFSVVISLILTLESAQVSRLDDLPTQMDKVMDNFKAEIDNIERLSVNEQSRQLNYLNKMNQACDQLVSSGIRVVNQRITERNNINIQTLMTSPASISSLTKDNFVVNYNEFSKNLDAYISNQLEILKSNMDYKYSLYSKHLKNTYTNPWLNFPLSIFNKSHFFVDSLYDFAKRPSNMRKRDVDFMTFLEDTNAEELHLLPTILWKKFDQLLPDYHTFNFDAGLPTKKSPTFSDLSNSDRSTSFRYFSSNDDSKYDADGAERSAAQGSSTAFYTTDSKITLENQPHARKRVSHSFNLVKLRLILLVVDILILVYRFYHTYATVRTLWMGKPALVDTSVNNVRGDQSIGNNSSNDRQQSESSCSWQRSGILGHHFQSIMTGLMVLFILIFILLTCNKNSMKGILLTEYWSEYKLLHALAQQWSLLNSKLTDILNGPAFLGAFKYQSKLQTSRLLQLISRFNYDQSHIKKLYLSQACFVSGAKTCELSSEYQFSPLSYEDQMCNYLSLTNQNISINVYEDSSTLHRVVEDCHSIIYTACVVTIAVLLLAACAHVLGMLFFIFVNITERRFMYLRHPPKMFDTFGRRIPQTPPAQPPDRGRRKNSLERLATHIEESNV